MPRHRVNQLGCAFGLLAAIASGLVGTACREGAGNGASGRPVATVEPASTKDLAPNTLTLPNSATSVKFAVIGDSGRGTKAQRDVALQMVRYHEAFRFPFTIMLGDNLYEGPASREDYRLKFEEPYRELLDDGVRFFAALGNHDDPREVDYEHFNMRGERYYSFLPPGNVLARITTRVEFFALDSTYLDRGQLQWLDEKLAASTADWKICFLHHPIYTSGRYRAAAFVNRSTLESTFLRHNVSAVFSGHEHIYQRSILQNGIQYFISGAAGSLRPGDGVAAGNVARTYSEDYHFMLVEIEGDALHFQAIARTGVTIDAGTLTRAPATSRPLRPATPADTAAHR
jgi:hypothetical protein